MPPCNVVCSYYNNWASMSEPHTRAFNVKFCLYGTYVGQYVAASMAGSWSVGHSHCTALLPPHAPIVLPHSVSFTEQVRPHLSDTGRRSRKGDTDRWSRKGWLLRLGMDEPPHCAAYALLPCSCSPPQCSTLIYCSIILTSVGAIW